MASYLREAIHDTFHRTTPAEEAKKWTRQLKREQRSLDRELRGIEREEQKLHRQLKLLAKKQEINAMKPLAMALVRSKKAKERLYLAKAELNSVSNQIRIQASQVKMSNCFKQSTKVMVSMGKLIKIEEVSQITRDMAYEMEKAGLIQEMMDDALEVDDPEMDEEVEQQVDQIISELTINTMNAAPLLPMKKPTTPQEVASAGKELFRQGVALEEDGSTNDLERRLAALQSY